MNFVLNFILLSVALLKNVINSEFKPALAFFHKLPVMYLTNDGWVAYENTTNIMKDDDDAVKFCQILYPEYNITNAMHSYHTEMITNWCIKNENCTKNDQQEVNPILCINATYKVQQRVPKNCNMEHNVSQTCLPFSEWRSTAQTFCQKSGKTLFNFQMIYFTGNCAKTTMRFNQIETVCCPKPENKNYKSDLENYETENGTTKEHTRFIEIKKTFWKNYTNKLESWRSIVRFRMKKIYFENNSKHLINQNVKNLRMSSKDDYSNFNNVFGERFLLINKIHIGRILHKSEQHCVKLEQNNSLPNNCVIHLNMTINHLKKHYVHILLRNSTFVFGYNTFLIQSLNKLKNNLSALFNNDKNLLENLQNTVAYLKYKIPTKSQNESFKQEFDLLASEADKFSHNDRQTSNSPMMSVVVTSVILLVLIVLTFLATVIIKYCGQPFRRSPPNYIMSVVFNTNQAPLVSRRSDQQASGTPRRPDVKLNLYENPIFNSKSSSKPIEKQSLIENIEA